MLRDNELIGYKRAKYVMDRGFFSADNLRFMTKAGARFIISVPNSSLFAKELIGKYRNQIVNHFECRLGKDLPYRRQKIKDIPAFGKHIFLYLRKRGFRCPHCGKRFYEENGFLLKYHRMTNRLLGSVI